MATKIGIDQTGSPAPKWWRRLERAIIIIIAPSVSAFITANITDEKLETRYLQLVLLVVALVKGVGMFLGTDQDYEGQPISKPE